MKNIKLIPYVLIVLAIALSACGSVAEPDTSTGARKSLASTVAFTGVVESINGDQWVVNGQSIKLDMHVDSSVIKDGPFVVGDTVTVEAHVNADGSVVAVSVATPSTADLGNTNSGSADEANNANSNENSASEVSGIVDAITATSITVGGQTYQFLPGFEMIIPGAFVDIQLVVNGDGTVTVSGVELSGSSPDGNDNSNTGNSNDDNGNGNDNDDNGNDD